MTAEPDTGCVIDLGEGHGALPENGGTRWRPDSWRLAAEQLGTWRTLVLALALLLVLGVGGAAVLPAPPLRLIARVAVANGASIMVDHDRIMVLGDGQTVAAYAVGDGHQLWRADLGMQAEYGAMTVTEGVVLVSRDQDGSDSLSTDAIDEDTGAVLWRSTAQLYTPVTGTGTALMQPEGGVAALQLVDLHTGVPRWTVPSQGCQLSFDQPKVPPVPHAFALLCRDGTLRLVSVPSGATKVIALPAYSTDPNAYAPQMMSVGGMLVIERWDGKGSTVIETRRWDDGARVWVRPGFGGQDILFPCDGAICVESQGLAVGIDPRTGGGVDAPHSDGICCGGVSVFVAPGTRATVLLVPSGRQAPVPPQPGVTVLLTQPELVSHALSPFLMVQGNRPQSIDRPPAVTVSLVEVVDANGGVRPLQRLPGINATLCTAVAVYLVCPTAAGEVTVWQYPTD